MVGPAFLCLFNGHAENFDDKDIVMSEQSADSVDDAKKSLKAVNEDLNQTLKLNVGSTMYSVSGALRAAAQVAALEQCRIIHAHAVVTGFESHLVDGYGKSGLVFDARQVFDELLPNVNIVGWNVLMSSYAQHGDGHSVIELFNRMKNLGVVADELSFLAILTACSNAGLVDEAEKWLNCMRLEYGMEPGLEHYTCLVSAMAKDGRLEDAEQLTVTMSFEPDAAVWRTMLSACAVHGAAEMASAMGERLLRENPKDDLAYSILANVNAAFALVHELEVGIIMLLPPE